MPFSRPSPQALRDRLAAEVEAALPGADARLRRSIETILVRMLAIASHEMHGHLAWIAEQILPDTAEAELLERHAAIWGIQRRAAAAATGSATFTGTPGAVVPAGTELRRADGATFTVTSAATIGAGGTVAAAIAAALAGAAGNTAAGTVLALTAPVAAVQSTATVAAGGLGAGAEAETDAELRARVLQRIQEPPAGGRGTDYRGWALAVAGVERVWVYPGHLGPGTVGVTFLASGGAIPGSGLVAAVQAAIDALRPVTANVTVFAPVAAPQALTIQLSPDTAAARAAVLAELAEFFRRDAEPGGTLRLSRLSDAISGAAGETWHRIVSPTADVALSPGQIATLGTVTWA